MDRVEQLTKIQKEALELFTKKNRDYGDAFAKYGTIGVLVRIGDKLDRCISIEKNKVTLIDSESIKDTLIDLHNYSAMALMTLEDSENLKDSGDLQEARDLQEAENLKDKIEAI